MRIPLWGLAVILGAGVAMAAAVAPIHRETAAIERRLAAAPAAVPVLPASPVPTPPPNAAARAKAADRLLEAVARIRNRLAALEPRRRGLEKKPPAENEGF